MTYLCGGNENVIGVLPTGGGKSAAFEVAAATWLNKTIVVVVPFRSLLDLFVSTNQKQGVDAVHYMTPSSVSRGPPRLLFVSGELAIKPDFVAYVFLIFITDYLLKWF